MRALTTRLPLAVWLLLTACATPDGSTPGGSPTLAKIEHIVVIYAENRSFDSLYGLYPGASGLANATPTSWTQTDLAW